MKSKFEEFNEGIVDIYTVNENEELVAKKKAIRFGEENTSIERHYAAKSVGNELAKMIHIPMRKDITAHEVAVIENVQYEIEKADNYKDAMPPITKLSLTKLETSREREFANDEG